jgi:hypothetical protein
MLNINNVTSQNGNCRCCSIIIEALCMILWPYLSNVLLNHQQVIGGFIIFGS